MKNLNRIIALILIELIIIMPIYSTALTITNVKVDEISDKSALVTWQTDESATTKINYGESENNLDKTESDVSLVKNHSVLLKNLEKSTSYFFDLNAQTATADAVDNNSGQFYKFVTLEEDTVAPFIDVEIPGFVDTNELDIIGMTEINTLVDLFVNNQAVSKTAFDDGGITLYGVNLIPNQQNTILIRATDAAGNTAEKTFNVVSDLVDPAINLVQKIPDVVNSSSMTLTGSISEPALLEIILGTSVIYNATTSSFSVNLPLQEEENNLTIRATDNAGHVKEIENTIISDTRPATITEVKPVTGSFYYEGRSIIDLEFVTEPDADVKIVLDSEGKLYLHDSTRSSGDDGIVRYDDLDLEGLHFGPYSLEAAWARAGPIPISTQRLTSSYQTQIGTEASQRPVKIWIIVKDKGGHITTQQISYTIGTCWSGELDFMVLPLLEYQTPTLLSPERLEEGSEIATFVLSVNYTGDVQPGEWQIENIMFDKACRGGRAGEAPEFSLENDIRYNVSCNILPNSPSLKERNSAGTLWYIRYDLGSTKDFTDFLEDDWDDFARHELVFPLKLTIRYKEKVVNPATGQKEWKTKTQTKCMSVAYFVDIAIDPRDVLPDYMLEDWPDAMNDTINDLNETITKLEEFMEHVSIACLSSLGVRFILQIARKISCKLETRAAYIWSKTPIGQRKGEEPTCPTTDEGRMSLPLDEASRKGKEQKGVPITQEVRPKPYTQLKVTPGDPKTIYLKYRCPKCAGLWEAEEKLYQLERWTCDRIFCHKAPARWTGFDKGVEDLKLKEAEQKARSCATEDRAGVMSLRKVENCNREYGLDGNQKLIKSPQYGHESICYQYLDSLYVIDQRDYGPDKDNVYTLTEAYDGKGDSKLKVLKEGNTFATAVNEKCDEICKKFDSKAEGKCTPTKTCTDTVGDYQAGYLAGYSNDCWVGQNALNKENPQQCCCRVKIDKKEEEKKKAGTTQVQCNIVAGKESVPGETCQGWDYREQELNKANKAYGTNYPTNRYFEERDVSACFGQNYLFDSPAKGEAGKVPVLDPFRQQISTFQCLCLTGIRQRLLMFKNILTGMRNCLISIRETGEADAGVCKELFTQYICDVFYQLFTWVKQKCIPLPFGKEMSWGSRNRNGTAGVGGLNIDADSAFEIGLGSTWETIKGMGSSIEAEYGGSEFSNYLQMGEKEISRKICLAAFGFDVGLDFDTLTDLTYQTQFSSSVLGLGLRRDFLTYNPDNELSTYAYRGAWTIYPGCKISSYKIDLTCVNLEERSKYKGIDCGVPVNPDNTGGCDCLYSPEPYAVRSKSFYIGNELAVSVMEDKDQHTNVESLYRYDHIRLQLFLHQDSDPNKCLPEGHKDGIFYFPITDRTARDILDCVVDERGIFKCSRGLEWEQKGEAYFQQFSAKECSSSTGCNLLCFDNNPANDTEGKQVIWRNCDEVVFPLNNVIKVKPKIYGKKRQCLKATVTSESGEKVYEEVFSIGDGLSGLEQSYTISDRIFDLGLIGSDAFIGTGINIISSDISVCKIQRVTPHSLEGTLSSSISGNLIIQNTADPDKFSITSKPNDMKIYNSASDLTEVTFPILNKARSEISNYLFAYGGFTFKLNDINSGVCNVKAQTGTGKDEQKWKLHMELLYPDSLGSCGRTTERIFKIGYNTDIDKLLDVHRRVGAPTPITAPNASAAPAAAPSALPAAPAAPAPAAPPPVVAPPPAPRVVNLVSQTPFETDAGQGLDLEIKQSDPNKVLVGVGCRIVGGKVGILIGAYRDLIVDNGNCSLGNTITYLPAGNKLIKMPGITNSDPLSDWANGWTPGTAIQLEPGNVLTGFAFGADAGYCGPGLFSYRKLNQNCTLDFKYSVKINPTMKGGIIDKGSVMVGSQGVLTGIGLKSDGSEIQNLKYYYSNLEIS